MITRTDFQIKACCKLTDPFSVSKEIMDYKTNSVKNEIKIEAMRHLLNKQSCFYSMLNNWSVVNIPLI